MCWCWACTPLRWSVLRDRTSRVGLMNAAFYLLLLLNTYFSVTFTEAACRVRCPSDVVVSVVLIVMYLVLPWSVHQPQWFFLLMAAFFCLAVVKYANWLTRVDAAFFLRRKIIANTLGAAESVAALAGLTLLDRPELVTLIALVLYAYGNLHTLLIDPLYRHEQPAA